MEISLQGEGKRTEWAVVNQMWAWLFIIKKTLQHTVGWQLHDTTGTATFPLYRDLRERREEEGR